MEATEGKAEQLQRDFILKEKRDDLDKKLNKLLNRKNDIDIQLEDLESRFNHKRRAEVRSWLEDLQRVETEIRSFEADGSELVEAKLDKSGVELDQLIRESVFDKGLVLDEFQSESISDSLPSASFVGDDSFRVMGMDPLPEDASLQLFAEKLGNYATFSSEVRMVVKSVVEECAGSPLALVTLGGSMSGVDDLTEWTNVLQELRGSNLGHGYAEQNVSRILKCCYARLKDPALQQCFRLCALFPKDYQIVRECVKDYLISAGVIKGFQTRSAKMAKGHTLLSKLERVCLLECCENTSYEACVKMHDLVRDAALDLMRQDSSKAMVQAGKLLREIPVESEWTEDLEAVSLMENDIKEIPPGHSPPCPNLSILVLCHNKLLQSVADSFFLQLHGLTLLDLSYTAVEVLPDSISTLVSLNCLLIHHCNRLRKIPSLAALKLLEKLDLSSSPVENVPQGLELLTNLSYLDMEGIKVDNFPTGILPQLSSLQHLNLDSSTPVEGEVGRLCKLESLCCHFKSPHEFYTYVHHGCSVMDSEPRQILNDYELTVGEYDDYLSIVIIHADDWEGLHKRVAFNESSIGEQGDLVAIPKDLEGMFIANCHDVRSFGNAFLVEDSTSLELLQVGECEALECLVALSSPSKILESVKGLTLHDLEKLQVLISIDQGPSFPSCSAFSCLTSLLMWRCPNLKYLFPCELLPNLRNVESIIVQDCKMMEEIIAYTSEECSSSSRLGKRRIDTSEAFGLPKLKFLTLEKLSNLKTISSETISCDSIQEIQLWECPELKRISLSLTRLHNGQPHPLPSLKKIRIRPEEWWDSAELDQPNSKDALQPFLTTSSWHYSDEVPRDDDSVESGAAAFVDL